MASIWKKGRAFKNKSGKLVRYLYKHGRKKGRKLVAVAVVASRDPRMRKVAKQSYRAGRKYGARKFR